MGVTKQGSNEGGKWGLGLLLVFSPEENHERNIESTSTRRRRSSDSLSDTVLFSKAQSTIYVCALLVFFTLLLFALSTFEPISTHTPIKSASANILPRRWLRESREGSNGGIYKSALNGTYNYNIIRKVDDKSALNGLGVVYRRGTKAMSDMVVAHITEDTKEGELRLFLRSLHRSGITSKSDVALIFPSNTIVTNPNLLTHDIGSSSTLYSSIIHEENEAFLKLVEQYKTHRSKNESTGFDVSQFLKSGKRGQVGGAEPIWGRKIYSGNYNNVEDSGETWGSVVGFEAAELDPEDSLSGFYEHRLINLRRWACYPMLLGRVRRSFKHIMLVNVKDVLVLGDSLSKVRNRGGLDSVYYTKSYLSHSPHKKEPSSGSLIIMGGTRGVRRLSSAMLNEMVKASTTASTQRKSKNLASESTILSQLIRNEALLKSTNIVANEVSIPDYIILHRGHNNRNEDLDFSIGKKICLSTLNSSLVYTDC